LDALNVCLHYLCIITLRLTVLLQRHLRSEGGTECRHTMARQKAGGEGGQKVGDPQR
jgi:hypothetical protein